jgi:hypothetical protein
METPAMRIQIHDDNQNFLNWGNLVLTWIRDKTLRPTTVGQLKALLTAKGITATVDGPDTRGVEFWDYPEGNDPIQIALPTKPMLEERLQTVRHPGGAPYPLPHFYDIAFAGATRAQLSEPVSLEFAARRIGEYSVNECC